MCVFSCELYNTISIRERFSYYPRYANFFRFGFSGFRYRFGIAILFYDRHRWLKTNVDVDRKIIYRSAWAVSERFRSRATCADSYWEISVFICTRLWWVETILRHKLRYASNKEYLYRDGIVMTFEDNRIRFREKWKSYICEWGVFFFWFAI